MTISSEVLATFTFTWQPVCASNGWTQSWVLSFEPSSAYPAQAMMFSWPSPAPTLVAIAMSGRVLVLDEPVVGEPLQADNASTAAHAAATAPETNFGCINVFLSMATCRSAAPFGDSPGPVRGPRRSCP